MARSNLPSLFGNNSPSRLFRGNSDFDRLNNTRLRPTEFVNRLEYGRLDRIANRDDYYNTILQRANVDISHSINETIRNVGKRVNLQLIEEIITTVKTVVQTVGDLEPSQRQQFVLSKDKTVNDVIDMIPSVSNRIDIDENTKNAVRDIKQELIYLWETTKETVAQQNSKVWKSVSLLANGAKSLGSSLFNMIGADIPIVGQTVGAISGLISNAWQKRQQRREFEKAANIEDQRIRESLSGIRETGSDGGDGGSGGEGSGSPEPEGDGTGNGSGGESFYNAIVRADLFTNKTWFDTIGQLIDASRRRRENNDPDDPDRIRARRENGEDIDIIDQEIPKGTYDDPIFVTLVDSPIIDPDDDNDSGNDEDRSFLRRIFGGLVDGSIFRMLPASVAGLAAGLVPAITAIAPVLAVALGGAVAVAVAAFVGKKLHEDAKIVNEREDSKLEEIERDRIRQEQRIIDSTPEGPERDKKLALNKEIFDLQKEGALASTVDDPNSNFLLDIKTGFQDLFGTRRNAKKDAEKLAWIEADEKQRMQAKNFEKEMSTNQELKGTVEQLFSQEQLQDQTIKASLGNANSTLRQSLEEAKISAGENQERLLELQKNVVNQFVNIKENMERTAEAEKKRDEERYMQGVLNVGNSSGQFGGGWKLPPKPSIYPTNLQMKIDSAPIVRF